MALDPKPKPSTTPAAIAMMFFTAAAISTPIKSELVYSRKRGPDNSACKRSRSRSSGDATTSAVGSPCATSGANVGPEMAATCGTNRGFATSVNDFGHAHQSVVLDAFRRADKKHVGADERQHVGENCAIHMRRRGDDDDLRSARTSRMELLIANGFGNSN